MAVVRIKRQVDAIDQGLIAVHPSICKMSEHGRLWLCETSCGIRIFPQSLTRNELSDIIGL